MRAPRDDHPVEQNDDELRALAAVALEATKGVRSTRDDDSVSVRRVTTVIDAIRDAEHR